MRSQQAPVTGSSLQYVLDLLNDSVWLGSEAYEDKVHSDTSVWVHISGLRE